MAQYSVVLSPSAGASISLVLDLTQASQNVAGNYSTVNYNLYLYRNNTGGSSSFDSTNTSVKSLTINGTTLINANTNWDFRSSSGLGGVGATNALGSGSINIPHNADGTKTFSFSAAFTDGGTVTIGHGSISNSMALTTIPRASTPTYSANPADAGTTITITTNRASGSFTHDISYVFGAASGSIGTGVGASTTWAIPLSLLNQIPNNTSGTATITTVTKSGATTIGSKVQNLTIRAASDIVPDFTTVTHSEATTSPDVAAIVGAYVKDWSTLDVDITGAVGAYGSTISAYKIELLDGSTVLQTINAASGVTTPITTSGTLTLRGTVTDSRSRTYSEDVSVSVLNYSLPVIELFTVARSTVGGTPDINGEYILIDLEAAVQSLIVGTQKNDLTWRIKTRERTDSTPWTSITADYEDTVGAVGYDDDYILGTYPEANSYDIRVEVEDELGGIAFIEGVISTGGVLMQWSKTFDGVGFGKYWEQGSIDALDQIYQRNGKRVLDEDDLVADATTTNRGIIELATAAEVVTGTDADRAVTPATFFSTRAAGLQGRIPSSVAVGSGSASVAADGTITFTGVSSISLNGIFDGLGMDTYEIYLASLGSVAAAVSGRLRAAGTDVSAGNYRQSYVQGFSSAVSSAQAAAATAWSMIVALPNATRHVSRMTVINPGAATPTSGVALGEQHDQTTGAMANHSWSYLHSLSTAYDGFTVFPGAGTLSGVIKVVKVG